MAGATRGSGSKSLSNAGRISVWTVSAAVSAVIFAHGVNVPKAAVRECQRPVGTSADVWLRREI